MRACGLAGSLLLTTAVSAQVSLIQPAFPSEALQRTEVRSPVGGLETIGDKICETKIAGYEATATQLIVKIASPPKGILFRCGFEDLKFILNGKAYNLEGLDGNFSKTTIFFNGFVWTENAQANSWMWFQIGSRLPVDALERAQGSLGVYACMCRPNTSCLTSPRVDVAATEPLVAAARAELVDARAKLAATANASAGTNDNRAAPMGVRRVTALLLPKTATGPQTFNAHNQASARCDFVWPFDGVVLTAPRFFIKSVFEDIPERGQYTFIWTGACNSAKMLQGTGQLFSVQIPTVPQTESPPRTFIDQIEFDNGIQKGRIVDWRADYSRNVGFSGAAENFKFSGIVNVKGTQEDRRFAWVGGALHPSWYNDSAKAYACGSNTSDSQCIWASTNYNASHSQYKSFQAQGQCREMARVSADMKSKGGVELSSYDEETCQANSQLAVVLSGRDPQAMYLAGARYENNNDRPRAKRIYLTLMEKFPKSSVSVNAADRLSRLSDVEAVESATSQAANRAANASFSAAESVRKQNYDQCNNDRMACRDRCYSIKDSSARSRCQDGCPLCSR